MTLQDIKKGSVIWNQWEYSIMGRDTGTKSTYFLVLALDEHDGKKGNVIHCQVRAIDSNKTQNLIFEEDEIKKGWLRLATQSEIKRIKIETKGKLEQKILEHKTAINLLEEELSELDNKYKEFIDQAT